MTDPIETPGQVVAPGWCDSSLPDGWPSLA